MNDLAVKDKIDISIVLCGQAGQGIQTVEKLFTRVLKAKGWHVFTTKEYMSRVRGGMNSTLIRISDQNVNAFVDRIDIFMGLNKGALHHLKKRIDGQTVIVGDKDNLADEVPDDNQLFDIPFTKIASDIGNKVYSNTVSVGVLMSLLSIPPDEATECLTQFFDGKSQEIIDKNREAIKEGYEQGNQNIQIDRDAFNLSANLDVTEQILVNGAEAVGLGAIAGGCNFISSYPMSPSTGVLTFLAQNGPDFGIVAEQAEDEIAAVNMAIGAWYAGARAIVSTSGGGFALMTEGISLAGMFESPLVIHLAQRPGPATGLPTRTEQGDLDLALYAGHGEFPRILLAPATLEDGFYLTQKAFNLADQYQVPVIILTDQYYVDSYYDIPPFDLEKLKIEKHVVETSEDYQRYELTENGVSPRGIPGLGKGLVCLDSDEHDQQGHITEDFDIRVKMVDKRLKKLELIKDEAIPPELQGADTYKNLIICWGSTYHIVSEAVNSLERSDTAVLHFTQVYPLHHSAADIINKAETTIVVENNATGQFSRLLKIYADINVDHQVLKYDGLSFAADTLAKKLDQLL